MKKRFVAGIAVACAMAVAFSGCKKIEEDKTRVLSDYSEYVTLGEFKGLEIEVEPADVTDKQLQETIDSIIEKLTTKEELKEGTVKDKDMINLDFTGYLDGEAFDNGSATGYDYTIGGGFIKDLNDQLIGLEVGKEYDLDCTFPEDYGNEDLNGKAVVFKVTVNCIYGEDIVPEWNDELIKSYTKEEYTTVADYEKYLKDSLYEQNLEKQKSAYQYALWATIIENCTRNGYPEDKVEMFYNEYYNYYKNYYTYIASYFGVGYEEYLELNSLTDEDVQKDCRASAESELEYMMVASEIAKVEKISLSSEEVESLEADIVEQYSYGSIEEFESEYASYGENYLYESFIFDTVSEYLMEQNKMVITEAVEDEGTEE
ncbi:MAG: trigger factor [Butyrivibrio sp.]